MISSNSWEASACRSRSYQELTADEVLEVNGGILPFIAAVVVIDVALIAFTRGMVDGATEAAND